MRQIRSSDPKGAVLQSIAGAIGVTALLSGTAALLSIPNFIPVVALEVTKTFLGFLLLWLAGVADSRRGPVLLFLSLIPAISAVESFYFFPFFYRPDSVLAVLIVGHLTELILVAGLALIWLRWSAVVPILLAGIHLFLIFERMRDEPAWLQTLPLLVGVLFALMVHFMVRSRTERHETELQLRQVETLNHDLSIATAELARYRQREMLAALAASVAHEINNPANYVSGSLMLLNEKLKKGAAADPGAEELLDLIESAQHGMETINQVTSRLRAMFRESDGPPEEINLRDLARSVVAMLREPAKAAGPTVTVEIPQDLTMKGHPADFHILLSNLVQNGMAAAGPDGTVAVKARQEPEALYLVVEDDGPGFSREMENKLFEPFVSGTPDGTGIGLSLCKTVVEKRGGTIRAERPEGGPTRFVVSISGGVE